MFQVIDYDKELKIMENLTKEEYLASLRRYRSSPMNIVICHSQI